MVAPRLAVLKTTAVVQNIFPFLDDLLLFETHVPFDDKPSVIYISCPDLNPLKDVRVSALTQYVKLINILIRHTKISVAN